VKSRKKERVGKVISDKMDKTVVVCLERKSIDPLYGKRIKKRKKIKAYDKENKCCEGDTVKIVETRPLSKEKHWRVVEIISRGER